MIFSRAQNWKVAEPGFKFKTEVGSLSPHYSSLSALCHGLLCSLTSVWVDPVTTELLTLHFERSLQGVESLTFITSQIP